MSDLPFFIFEEHSGQKAGESLEGLLRKSNISEYNLSNDNRAYLGLDENFRAGYFVGMRWINWKEGDAARKGVIWVKPKHGNIPYQRLLWRCLDQPVVCNHLDDCYQIFAEEPSIPLNGEENDLITPLLITDFLVRVQKIARRGLKRSFVNTQNILQNRVKGKILVNQSCRLQLKTNQISQVHCSYHVHTSDCIENQIIKAALLQAQKYICRYLNGRDKLKDVLKYNLNAFDEVSLKKINPIDFHSVHHNSFQKEYVPAVNLAKLILKGIGFSANSDISLMPKTIPPFYINMPELFERYCEVLLREKFEGVLSGYSYKGFSETRLGKSRLRPDFIIPSQNMIIDSKYKYWIDESRDMDGIIQLSRYSRHKKALEKLSDGGYFSKLQFLYPKDDGELEIDFDSDKNEKDNEYPEVFKYPLSLINMKGKT